MKKKKIVIISFVFVIFLIGCYILINIINQSKKEIIKLCLSETTNEGYITKISYQLWLDNNNNVTKIKELKEYVYDDKIEYFYKIHNLQDKNLDITLNDETKTISIHGYEGELVNDKGEIITVPYDEYIEQNLDDNYKCSLIK